MTLKNEYLKKVFEQVQARDKNEPEFLQTVEESQSHWLDCPIIPNRITKPINELFV